MSQWCYDVFLSCRSQGRRKNFTDHLYAALVRDGFLTLIDKNEIAREENNVSEICRAIQGSKIIIVVLSIGYAHTRWCLDQLQLVMEGRRTVGNFVLPIYYDVDPSQVREQRGSIAQALGIQEEFIMGDKYRLQGWRAALREIADLSGIALQNQYKPKSQIIQDIVQGIKSILNHAVLNVPSYLVGLDHYLALINSWLQNNWYDVRIATIYGIGGIGKTTIAKTIFNRTFGEFEGSSFLANVSEGSREFNGLVSLQRQLLSDLLRRKAEKIRNVDEGIIRIKDVVRHKRVLLILDDVGELDQFSAIVGNIDWFSPGSKIIITTRHKNLLRAYDVSKIEVQKLNYNESVQLFSWHAFGHDQPQPGYEKYTEDVMHHCDGLALALEVWGSYLFGRSEHEWVTTIQKMRVVPHPKIQSVLRKSFNWLYDDHDKKLFLYIACFLAEMDEDYVIRILDGLNFRTKAGIQNLVDRCLITITEEKKLLMHPMLRDMGREIVHHEPLSDPRKPHRLRDEEDSALIPIKAIFEWVFILINLVLEILLLVIDQTASPQSPECGLVALLASLLAMLLWFAELVYKGRKRKVILKWQGIRCWFHYPPSDDKPFYSWLDFFSLACAITQSVLSSIGYSYLRRHKANPIKMSVVSVIFIISMAASKLFHYPNEEGKKK